MKNSPFYEDKHDRADVVNSFTNVDIATLPHFHRCTEILYVAEGNVKFNINNTEKACSKDDIVFVPRCTIHELEPLSHYINHIIIIGPQFSDDFRNIFQAETLPVYLLDKPFNQTILPHFQTLAGLKDVPKLVYKGYIDIIIGSLLGHYPCSHVKTLSNIETVVSILNYIDEHYREPLDLKHLSAVFGYSKYYFSHLFNTYIGSSLNHYINGVRLRNIVHAAKKMEHPNLTDLALTSGFESMATFYRAFSQYYGRTPKAVFKEH